jgi:hypothetical protein
VAESSTKIFFDTLSESLIQDGLLPRFLVIQYNGPRGYMQNIRKKKLPFDVYGSLQTIAEKAISYRQNNAIHVDMDEESEQILTDLDIETTDDINAGADATDEELLNRVHLLSIRVSALLAVADRPEKPVIKRHHVEWSIRFVRGCFDSLRKQFIQGEVGDNCSNDIQTVRKAVEEYLRMDPTQRMKSKRVGKKVANMEGVVPMSFLHWRLMRTKRFAGMGQQALSYFEKLTNVMVREGALVIVASETPSTLFTKGPCF